MRRSKGGSPDCNAPGDVPPSLRQTRILVVEGEGPLAVEVGPIGTTKLGAGVLRTRNAAQPKAPLRIRTPVPYSKPLPVALACRGGPWRKIPAAARGPSLARRFAVAHRPNLPASVTTGKWTAGNPRNPGQRIPARVKVPSAGSFDKEPPIAAPASTHVDAPTRSRGPLYRPASPFAVGRDGDGHGLCSQNIRGRRRTGRGMGLTAPERLGLPRTTLPRGDRLKETDPYARAFLCDAVGLQRALVEA